MTRRPGHDIDGQPTKVDPRDFPDPLQVDPDGEPQRGDPPRPARGDWGCSVFAVALLLALLAGCNAQRAGNATPQYQEGGGYLDIRSNIQTGRVIAQPAVASAASGQPMTLAQAPLPTMPAEPAGNGLGVRSGGSRFHAGAPLTPEPGYPGSDAAPAPGYPGSDGGSSPEVLAGGTTQNRVVTGTASWYAAKGDQGAVPWWKPGQEPLWATVSRFADGRTYGVTVLITGWCGCLQGQPGERVIDLSDGAFAQLAPLSVGLIRVTVELTDAGPGLPATDLEGP